MTIPQQFSLRWNNYSQHIVSALEDLRSDDEFTDVTLSCEGERLKAHKILLSACSTYFRDTFRENPLRFMYNGQVNVSQERLPSFLQTAELLQIKGLTDMNEKEDTAKKRNGSASTSSQNLPSNVDSNSRSATPDVPPRPPTPKRKRIIVGGYPNDGASSSGNISFSSSSAVSTQPIVVASSSNGPSTSGGGLLNPQSVVIPSTSSIQVNEEEFQDVSIVKYEDDDTQEQEDEYEEKHMSSDNDNSAHDMLCNVEPGSIGVFGGNGPSGMNATGVESSSHGKVLGEITDEEDESDWTPPLQPLHPSQFQIPEILNEFGPMKIRPNSSSSSISETNIIITNCTSVASHQQSKSHARVFSELRRRSLPQIVTMTIDPKSSIAGSISCPVNMEDFNSKFIGFNPPNSDDEDESSGNRLGKGNGKQLSGTTNSSASAGDNQSINRCEICGKNFTLKTNLTAHRRRHTGETECPFCDKTLSTVGNLRSHIQYVHNGMPLPPKRPYKSSGVYYNKNIRAALEFLDAEMVEGDLPIVVEAQ